MSSFYNATSPAAAYVHAPFGAHAATLIDWHFPVSVAALYFVTVKTLSAAQTVPSKPVASHWTNAAWFKALVVLHNVFLAVFSGITFVGMAKGLYGSSIGRGAHEAFCDRDDKLWNASLGYYAWLFYLSKYYEFVDTAIILLKGRKPSLLQSYHHAGAVLCMWLCVRSAATGTWIFVLFNSFIHTLMYTYYTLTTLGVSPHPPLKRALTQMQIAQFLIGGAVCASYPMVPGCLKRNPVTTNHETAAYAFVLAYLVPLVYLFVDFARRVYGRKTTKTA
ncbi:hypothetical protein HKX48_001474 [Thoreauomyces humboldtii]|nr:hypothetical protein HKX48_001474 [Thoreauomyces humboldtii]